MSDQQFELWRKRTKNRSSGGDYAFELRIGDGVVVSGSSTGRMLRKPAMFSSTEGDFTIRPESKFANCWVATWSTGPEIARFDLANLGRGKTRIDTPEGTLTFRSFDPALVDAAKAMVLAHTNTFQLFDASDNVLGVTGKGRPKDSFGGFVRAVASSQLVGLARFGLAESLTVIEPSWKPDPAQVAALLVYLNQVVVPVRSPG